MELLAEIKEDIRREKLEKLWQRFGIWIISTAVLVVVSSGLIVAWKYFQETTAAKQGGELFLAIESLNNGELEKSKSTLTETAKNNSSAGVLANLRLASIAIEANDKSAAKEHYQAVIKTPGVAKEFLDLALLQNAKIALQNSATDQAEISTAIEQLKHISADNLSPWRAFALEQLATYYLQKNETKKAEEFLTELARLEGLSETQKERVELLISTLHKTSDK